MFISIFSGNKFIVESLKTGRLQALNIKNILPAFILLAASAGLFYISSSPANIHISSASPTKTYIPSPSTTLTSYGRGWFSCETCGEMLNIKFEFLSVTTNKNFSTWNFHTENHSYQLASNLHVTSLRLQDLTTNSAIDCGNSSSTWSLSGTDELDVSMTFPCFSIPHGTYALKAILQQGSSGPYVLNDFAPGQSIQL